MERKINLVQVTASRFYGGPERQMIALAQSLPSRFRTTFISFGEGGLCRGLLDKAHRAGFQGIALEHDTPWLWAALNELTAVVRRLRANVLCCQGYKADLLGLLAARRLGVPVISTSRGWTGENLRVRLYEALDRLVLRWMDKVVCVSAAQAHKVRGIGVRDDRAVVIHNAIRGERFSNPDPGYRDLLRRMFAEPPQMVIGAAGRLSPEKGFEVLIDAAAQVLVRRTEFIPFDGTQPIPLPDRSQENGMNSVLRRTDVGFVLFGDGPLRGALAREIARRSLQTKFVLAGFRADLDRYLPHLDLFVQVLVHRGPAECRFGGPSLWRAGCGHGGGRNVRGDPGRRDRLAGAAPKRRRPGGTNKPLACRRCDAQGIQPRRP